MVINGGFWRIYSSTSLITTSTFTPLLRTKFNLSYVLIPSSNTSIGPFLQTQFNWGVVSDVRRNGFCVYAEKKRRGGGGTSLSEMEELDYDEEDVEDGDFDDEDEGEGEDEDEDDDDVDMILQVGEMKKWLENKPRGFGEGKKYDISIEDKLFDEMLQGRQAQAANINKLMNVNSNENVAKHSRLDEASAIVQSGFRVRVTTLPKKKNVHRDLKLAFNGVPGIINITPAVSGTKKTRDPVCKGFAFVDFKSKEEATRFVQIFSRQSVMFGKIQKQIKCEIVNSDSNNSTHEQSDNSNSYILPQLTVPSLEGDIILDANTEETFLDLSEESNFDEPDDEFLESESEDIKENLGSLSISELKDAITMAPTIESVTKDKTREIKKAKIKANKVPKLHIPGSAKRLKIKEKAILNTVFSKYGLKSALASKEES